MKEIYALGIGHATPLFIELAEACSYKVAGLYHYNDQRTGEIDHGFEVLGSFSDLFQSDVKDKHFVLTMGDMLIKQNVSTKLIKMGGVLPSLIHPSAIVSRFATISDNGVLIGSQCEIHSDSTIAEGCVLWPRVTIGHDCCINKYVFMGPNAYVGAYTKIGERAFIGQCSVLISGKAKEVGGNALIGAGALVTKPVPAGAIVAGHPARVIKNR